MTKKTIELAPPPPPCFSTTPGRGRLTHDDKFKMQNAHIHGGSPMESSFGPQSVGVARKFGEGVPAHVSSSLSDRGSKLRGPYLNSPLVASKQDINLI
ncbi:hypothetical protein AVEN_262505-1 [Araneus ventricosus]|uniref:Uncharacterized protein n=1 Tax=Araneus ventricosus TaxID=182803 RepID=A0A4Y2LH12_ARAVE|nr:hypothetical protein AVEN_262505-1 [Araneus ventricosus]